MVAKLFVLLCGLAAVMAYPYAEEEALRAYEEPLAYEAVAYEPVAYERVRRQVQLQGGGGGSPKTGYDVSIDARAPVWKSDNGRHQFDVTGGYSQHLGGPYGNSQPDKRVGGVYTFRF